MSRGKYGAPRRAAREHKARQGDGRPTGAQDTIQGAPKGGPREGLQGLRGEPGGHARAARVVHGLPCGEDQQGQRGEIPGPHAQQGRKGRPQDRRPPRQAHLPVLRQGVSGGVAHALSPLLPDLPRRAHHGAKQKEGQGVARAQ